MNSIELEYLKKNVFKFIKSVKVEVSYKMTGTKKPELCSDTRYYIQYYDNMDNTNKLEANEIKILNPMRLNDTPHPPMFYNFMITPSTDIESQIANSKIRTLENSNDPYMGTNHFVHLHWITHGNNFDDGIEFLKDFTLYSKLYLELIISAVYGGSWSYLLPLSITRLDGDPTGDFSITLEYNSLDKNIIPLTTCVIINNRKSRKVSQLLTIDDSGVVDIKNTGMRNMKLLSSTVNKSNGIKTRIDSSFWDKWKESFSYKPLLTYYYYNILFNVNRDLTADDNITSLAKAFGEHSSFLSHRLFCKSRDNSLTSCPFSKMRQTKREYFRFVDMIQIMAESYFYEYCFKYKPYKGVVL